MPRRSAEALGMLSALLVALTAGVQARGQDRPFGLAEAAEQGTFNVGDARAAVGRVPGPGGGDLLRLDYTLPPGTAAGVWSKGFPDGLQAGRVDVVRLGVRSEADTPGQVEAAAEIKGSAGVQRIPLPIGPDWAVVDELVDWAAVGELSEVVVLVSRVGDGPAATGTASFDVRFDHLAPLRRLGMTPAARLGAALLIALLGAGLAAALRAVARPLGPADEAIRTRAGSKAGGRRTSGPWRDFVRGVGVVGIAALAARVYVLGGRGPLEVGWTALWVAVGALAVSGWLAYGLAGRHLSPGEVFADLLAGGMLAGSTSWLEILQAPGSWDDLLQLNRVVAAAALLVYLGANAARIAAAGRHLGAVAGAMIVGTPYLFNALMLVRADSLVESLGGGLTAGATAAWPEASEFAGRVLVLFGINAVVAHALGLATRRGPIRSAGAHLAMLGVAAAAVASPWIAAFGSGTTVASWDFGVRAAATLLTTVLSQAGLWAEVYLLTGMALDAVYGRGPSRSTVAGSSLQGMRKAAVYSGTFMAILYGLGALWAVPVVRRLSQEQPVLLAAAFGALAFPLLKTIIETFDGSKGFFRRIGKSYGNPLLYLRGAVTGLGLGVAVVLALSERDLATRAGFGLGVGVAAYAGVDLLRDLLNAARGRGRLQPARLYLVHALLGGAIGAAVGFYLDQSQVAIVAAKFERYLSAGMSPEPFDVYPLLSKWGYIPLGTVSGGVALLYAEALAGVISWSIPAWLFAINRTFMAAYFRRESGPIRALWTRDGLVGLTEMMLYVLRWGLWMSPIINSFLRPMGEPTWYNQDGAIRTVIAIVQDVRLGPEAFRQWSLDVFIALLAYDAVRILIWLDHMGLRVATLVNLSFLGMDRLDRRLARFLSPAATGRCIPEGVKRFTTWAPLLVPFYIPRGEGWDVAWARSQAIMAEQDGGALEGLVALPLPEELALLAAGVVACSAASAAFRLVGNRARARHPREMTLSNGAYEVTLGEDGAMVGRAPGRGYDVSRRSYDLLAPAGRALFLVDASGPGPRAWPVLGNLPGAGDGLPDFERTDNALVIRHESCGIRTRVDITLPGDDDPVELWTVTIENLGDATKSIKVVPYLEWVLNQPIADRGHTQYNRLFAEMEYNGGVHAVLARDKHSKAMGLLAADRAPEGFLTSRIDFIGRARRLRDPLALESLAFSGPRDTDAHPTLDPIGSLLVGLTLAPRASERVRLLIGMTDDKAGAIEQIARHLAIPGAADVPAAWGRPGVHPIGHGAIPPGTPRPYSEFSEDGRRLLVRTPFTPRPFDHVMSNALGHVVAVTNRGLQTTSSVNSQQNRLTPDWSDIVTREVPGEAFYLFDPDAGEWFSPTYHPLNDDESSHEAEFGVDGTATYRMARGTLETELIVFVPPDEPAGIYRLSVRNRSDAARRVRLAPYFQMVLADQPEAAGPLEIDRDDALGALFFENPRNDFRTGPAFAACTGPIERVETVRGRFFGAGRRVDRPYLVENDGPAPDGAGDDRPIAAFLATLDLPAQGERTVVVVLGQADDRQRAEAVIRKLRDPGGAAAALEQTRAWWLSLMDTLRVRSGRPEFDRLLDWLKYQALAERIWSRRGFYQASGAFGFRDQLQDSVNLLWADPAIARSQILLHAAQQFLEGDVVHWFHRLQDGRTGFSGRTYASDNLLWLAWGVVEYVGATGDRSLLDERTPYLEAEQPPEPLPRGKEGMGFDPLRSTREDTVYRHCLRSIDLVLDHRMGAHGLPLILTGDWNDGLDEIGSEGRGESVWLGFFFHYILDRMLPLIEEREGADRRDHYAQRLRRLGEALDSTWRGDRYLRAIHDDGTEIGVEGSGIWEIDALTAAWAVMAGLHPDRGRTVFDTAVRVLERETTILLGWPPLREDTTPYLGRSSRYPEGVRENGMYCHGVQWLVGAARILAERAAREGRADEAARDRETAYRLWRKIAPTMHTEGDEIETYGGQPNKQAADMVTTFDPGRMIWHGYTGAAGWMFRQALEGVLGLRLDDGAARPPADPAAPEELGDICVVRHTARSPIPGPPDARRPAQRIEIGRPTAGVPAAD